MSSATLPFFQRLTALLLFSILCVCAQAITVTRVSWDIAATPENFNKFILEFDSLPRYNVADRLSESGFYYIDFYGLDKSYKRRILEIKDDKVLKYVDVVSFPESDVLRFVFYTHSPDLRFHIELKDGPPSIIIYTSKPTTPLPGAVANRPSAPSTNIASVADVSVTTEGISTQIGFEIPRIPEPGTTLNRHTSSGKKYIIIDPGHGGANDGARSNTTINGQRIREKDLTLKFAYELKKLIDSHEGMVGLMSRVDDSNVGLQERVKMAEDNRGNSGNLFISIHMNDASNTNARGMEVFFLNQKGTVDAAVREIEAKENREVGIAQSSGGQSLLNTMMTDLKKDRLEDWQYESYIFCTRLQQSMITEPYFARHNRGIKNANFVVLKNFEMPAVLLEVGFLSNSAELKNLVQPSFQEITAVHIYNAINAYFSENDPSFQATYLNAPRYMGQ